MSYTLDQKSFQKLEWFVVQVTTMTLGSNQENIGNQKNIDTNYVASKTLPKPVKLILISTDLLISTRFRPMKS